MVKRDEKIWKHFVQGINFDQKLIKEDILNSWKRCKQSGVSLYDFDIKLLMKPEEKSSYILNDIPEYNRANYREFCNIIENLNLNISIYDKDARLKYIINYDRRFDNLYPEIGYFLDVSEDKMGTNSTCMAIAENKPFMVIGPEHYKLIFHSFSCAAAPFYDGNDAVAGTINASFVSTNINNDTLNVIYSLARLYETLILKKIPLVVKKDTPVKDDKHRGLTGFDYILGESKAINDVKKIAGKAAQVDSAVLIYGESGSGKEVFAQAIHSESRRKEKPFVAINCGAIPKDLIESELFGYEAGTFTGAVKSKKGLLEYASGGTFFLDEVENMPLNVQIKLLRALSSASIMRIGGFEPIPIDVRIIAASKKELEEEIQNGNFREDFYYRINVIQIHIPALRERIEDIKLIIQHYIKTFSEKNNILVKRIEDEFIHCLEAYHWPGNVRELLNIIERSLVLSENGVMDASLIPFSIKERYTLTELKKEFNQALDNPLPKGVSLLEISDRVIIERVLKEENRNMSRTARRLGISRPTLYKKIKKFKL